MKIKVELVLLLSLASMPMTAQNTIVGKVVDTNNQPIAGVIVSPTEGGTTVTTDLDGQFEIAVEKGVSLSAASMGYKTTTAFSEPDMTIVLGKRGISDEVPGLKYAWNHFIMLNYGYSFGDIKRDGLDKNLHHIGLMYGQCRVVGWYARAMVTTDLNFAANKDIPVVNGKYKYGLPYKCYEFDNVDGGIPFYTGKYSMPYVSAIGGMMVRMGIPLYLYFGLGYAYHTTAFQTNANQWIGTNEQNRHNMAVECGLLGNIKGFAISAGTEFLFAKTLYVENFHGEPFENQRMIIKVGIGLATPAKKMNERVLAKKGGSK